MLTLREEESLQVHKGCQRNLSHRLFRASPRPSPQGHKGANHTGLGLVRTCCPRVGQPVSTSSLGNLVDVMAILPLFLTAVLGEPCTPGCDQGAHKARRAPGSLSLSPSSAQLAGVRGRGRREPPRQPEGAWRSAHALYYRAGVQAGPSWGRGAGAGDPVRARVPLRSSHRLSPPPTTPAGAYTVWRPCTWRVPSHR